jgi:hypothetical protein
MSDDSQGAAKAPSAGGISGDHTPSGPLEYLVAPTTSNELNTARLRLIPIACWRVDDVRFRFDSSFPLFDSSSDASNPNDLRAEFKALSDLVKAHPGSPLSVFGHADPVGNDDYNKTLSGRRAIAIYAMLIRDTSLWDNLFNKPFGGDNWHTDILESMQKATSLPKGTQNSVLFKSYMDLLCGAGFQLKKTDFLAQGADSGGKGDYQGCGEFNPLLVFSKETQSTFDAAAQKNDKDGLQERNAANAPNRRVMVLMFRKGSKVDPAKWPCPRATEGVAACKKRFFSDGEKRRSRHDSGADRTFEQSEDTFACRFYQRISSGSPCHALLDAAVVTEIRATLPGTEGLRDPKNNKRPDKIFHSVLDDEALDVNKPAILVRGCLDVKLQAITTPPNMPVSWLVKPNENDQPAPTITPTDGGKTATLRTDKAGSFSVVALLGVSKIVWNVVFAWVKVDPSSSIIVGNNSFFKDGGSDASDTSFDSGDDSAGKHLWQAKVKLQVFGGGSEKKIGVRKVNIHTLQNGTSDTLTGHYKGGGTAREIPKGPKDPKGEAIFPVLDATSGSSPFGTSPDKVQPPNNLLKDTDRDRDFFTADSPAGGFPGKHPKTHKRLVSISGVNAFVTAVASTTDDAPDEIVVHAKALWTADFNGKVDSSGTYTPDGAKVRDFDVSFKLISEATGGQDAKVAGFDTFEPRFNAGTDTVFDPKP